MRHAKAKEAAARTASVDRPRGGASSWPPTGTAAWPLTHPPPTATDRPVLEARAVGGEEQLAQPLESQGPETRPPQGQQASWSGGQNRRAGDPRGSHRRVSRRSTSIVLPPGAPRPAQAQLGASSRCCRRSRRRTIRLPLLYRHHLNAGTAKQRRQDSRARGCRQSPTLVEDARASHTTRRTSIIQDRPLGLR